MSWIFSILCKINYKPTAPLMVCDELDPLPSQSKWKGDHEGRPILNGYQLNICHK